MKVRLHRIRPRRQVRAWRGRCRRRRRSARSLRHKGLFVTTGRRVADHDAASNRIRHDEQACGGAARSLKNLATFTRQLHVLVAIGHAARAVAGCAGAAVRRTPSFRAVVADVRSSVEEGSRSSEAMREHPDYFDDVCRSLISAGEAGGGSTRCSNGWPSSRAAKRTFAAASSARWSIRAC